MSLMDIGPVIFGPTEDLIAWLRSKRLLGRTQHCSSCNATMRNGSDVSDGVVWRCPLCKSTKSIRAGSFKSRLPLKKWLLLFYYWSKQFPAKDAADDADIHKNSACDVYRWLREVCSSTTLLQSPIVLGGQGIVVQIDESLFRHKAKVWVYYVKIVMTD